MRHLFSKRPSVFLNENRGATAIEFALVSLPLFLIVLAFIDISVGTLRQYSLDKLSAKVARCISLNGVSQSREEFLAEQICSTKRPFMTCTDFEIGATVLSSSPSSIDTTSLISGWNLGASDDLIVVELAHPQLQILPVVRLHPTVDLDGESYIFSRNIIRLEPFAGNRTGDTC